MYRRQVHRIYWCLLGSYSGIYCSMILSFYCYSNIEGEKESLNQLEKGWYLYWPFFFQKGAHITVNMNLFTMMLVAFLWNYSYYWYIEVHISCLINQEKTTVFLPDLLSFTDLQRQGRALPEASLPFHRATPSTTHMALVELEKAGILKFLISQVGNQYYWRPF